MDDQKQIVLTKTSVERAPVTGKRYDLWDSKLAGFGLRVEASGTKTFVVRYRADGGGRTAPRRFMTVGRFSPMTAEQARTRATKILGAVANGDDPAGELAAKRKEMNIAALVDLYEAEGCFIQRGKRIGQPMKPLTKKYTINRLRHHVVPLLGNRRITEVRPKDIEKFSRDVAEGKTRTDKKKAPRTRVIVKGGEGAACKVVRDLSAVFSFAVHQELLESNPVMRARVRKTDNQRTRFLTPAELKRLGTAFDEVGKNGANAKAIVICKLWALTGCRRNEIAGLKWSELDFENGVFRFEDTKTGKSVRPLPWSARLLLRKVSRTEGTEYVFPAEDGDGFFQGTAKIWPAVKKASGLHDITPHTLRHTIGSLAVSHGENLVMTGSLLGHSNPRSTAIYAHVQLEPMRQASERVSRRVAIALGGPMASVDVPVARHGANDR
jgi:integrase